MSLPIANWVPYKRHESDMLDGKCKWDIVDVRLNDINFDASRKRQSRLMAGDRQYDETRVLQIGVDVEAGKPIPMVMLYRVKGEGIIIVGGLHRIGGCREYVGDKDNSWKVKAYMIREDRANEDFILNVLPGKSNTGEGLGLTDEIRKARAAELVSQGHSIEDAAAHYSLRVERLKSYISKDNLIHELTTAGVGIKTGEFSESVLTQLARLRKNRIWLTEAANVARQLGLSGKDLQSMAGKVLKCRDQSEGLAAIHEFARNMKGDVTSKGAFRKTPLRTSFLQWGRSLSNQLDKRKTPIANQFTVDDELVSGIDLAKKLIGQLEAFVAQGEEDRRRGSA